MLTVLCWFWRQAKSRAEYRPEHVNIWADMVRRNLSMLHRIACVTDIPEGIDPSIEIIAPPGDFLDIRNPAWSNGKPQCYRRLSMFRSDAADIFGERFVCMDIDSVVGGPLDPLFDRDDDLVLFKGTSPKRPYNGSMMLIRAGCRPGVFDDFNQSRALESGALFRGSDQAWLAHCLGWNEKTWGVDDGVYFFNGTFKAHMKNVRPRVLFFPGVIKPWHAVAMNRFIKSNYRRQIREAA